MKPNYTYKDFKPKWRHIISLLGAAILVASCAGNYGWVVYKDNVREMLATGQFPSDHTFHYNGPEASPRAVISIQNSYQLESKYWKPVPVFPDSLKEWMDSRVRHGYYKSRKNGSAIKSHDGSQIGIWYSVGNFKNAATIKMIDDNSVFVVTPAEGWKGGGR
jgi:hypothetical protein